MIGYKQILGVIVILVVIVFLYRWAHKVGYDDCTLEVKTANEEKTNEAIGIKEKQDDIERSAIAHSDVVKRLRGGTF